jgi:hypothetical protein
MIARAHRPPAHEAGFSVVEGLIAALILLIVVLGVLPLISQSMVNNAQGNSSSQEVNASVDALEELLSLPFNAPEVTVPSGQTSLVNTSYKLIDSNRFVDGVYGGTDTPQYQRTATIEYFSVTDLDGETDYTLDTPLDGGSLPGSIAFKRITMQVASQRVFNTAAYRVVTVQGF